MRSPLPTFDGIDTWQNGGQPNLSELVGHPVLVHFWSLSCYICHDVAEQVARWRDTYGPRGLKVIAVHQPRSEEELDVAKVIEDALGPMGITQPLAIDNGHTIVERFENQFVPAYYIFNNKHQLRHFQAGDKSYDRIEGAIERVLTEESEASEATA